MITRHRQTDTTRPIRDLAKWSRSIDPLAAPCQRLWLTRPGALTAGLRELGQLSLRVLRESIARPAPDERLAMKLKPGASVRIREICMSIDGTDCVVARSAVDLQAWSGSWQAMRSLGRRPLADLLYDDSRVTRSPFETARLRLPHPLANLTRRAGMDRRSAYQYAHWARRSVFWRDGHALLVSECFLPGLWDFVCA